MAEKEFLEKVLLFTQLPRTQKLIRVSNSFGDFLDTILKKQGGDTTELLDENKGEFEEHLIKWKRIITLLYISLDRSAIRSGFGKEDLRKHLSNCHQLGPASCMIKQFFGIIRNKEESLSKVKSLQFRRDDASGLENHMEIMISNIKECLKN